MWGSVKIKPRKLVLVPSLVSWARSYLKLISSKWRSTKYILTRPWYDICQCGTYSTSVNRKGAVENWILKAYIGVYIGEKCFKDWRYLVALKKFNMDQMLQKRRYSPLTSCMLHMDEKWGIGFHEFSIVVLLLMFGLTFFCPFSPLRITISVFWGKWWKMALELHDNYHITVYGRRNNVILRSHLKAPCNQQ